MVDKNRVIPVATLLLLGMVVTGPLLGAASGQILTEKTYYHEEFNDYNSTAIEMLGDDADLKNRHLTNTSKFFKIGDNAGSFTYGENADRGWNNNLDRSMPYFSYHFGQGCGWSCTESDNHGVARTIPVPNESDPVLAVETSGYFGNSPNWWEIQVDNKTYSTEGYNNAGKFSGNMENEATKIGSIGASQHNNWRTYLFPINESKQNITVKNVARPGGDDNAEMNFRQIYWLSGGDDAFVKSVEGYNSVSEDTSFRGPDPDDVVLIREETASGKETAIRSFGTTINREFTLDKISSKPQKVYLELSAESHSSKPVEFEVIQYGETISSGVVSAGSSAEKVKQLQLEDDQFTIRIQSEGQYDVNSLNVVGLQETSQGNPLASEGPVDLNPQSGYDSTVGAFINALNLTTSTLLYVVMVALLIGAVTFSYTKSVRGQELGQSLIYGAVIAGVVVVGLAPAMNSITWIFTGGTQRAPLADPALEAEPPTYYSTEFQDGTMNGWEEVKGSARPTSSGESFNLQMTEDGESAIVRKKTHISLGNSLSTGFVRMSATARSTPGYSSKPHQTSLRLRVYVTNGDAPNWRSNTADLTDDDLSQYDDLVVAREWASSFDGEVVNQEGSSSFNLEGNTIYVELVVTDNRGDELASASLNSIAVGATTESGHVG